MSDQNIEILRKDTYLKAIENSVGSKIFNSLFVKFKDTGKTIDVLNDGEYSCTFFVSSILFLVQAINKSYSTIDSFKKFLETNEKWQNIDTKDIKEGDVIFWEKVKYEDGTENAHVGFAFNTKEAISTDYKAKAITKHDIKQRSIESVYRFTW